MVKFLARGGPLGCFRLAADYAQIAFDTINTAMGDGPTDTPAQPVSCTALLAQQVGVSEPVSYTHLRAHETVLDLVCRLLLEKNNDHTELLRHGLMHA